MGKKLIVPSQEKLKSKKIIEAVANRYFALTFKTTTNANNDMQAKPKSSFLKEPLVSRKSKIIKKGLKPITHTNGSLMRRTMKTIGNTYKL